MDQVTEYMLRVGGVFGVGAASVVAGERQGRNSKVYEAKEQALVLARRVFPAMTSECARYKVLPGLTICL